MPHVPQARIISEAHITSAGYITPEGSITFRESGTHRSTKQKNALPGRLRNEGKSNTPHYDTFRFIESVIVGYLVFGMYFSEIGRRSAR